MGKESFANKARISESFEKMSLVENNAMPCFPICLILWMEKEIFKSLFTLVNKQQYIELLLFYNITLFMLNENLVLRNPLTLLSSALIDGLVRL